MGTDRKVVERIFWNGRTYRRYPANKNKSHGRYFYRSSAKGSPKALHRDVWEFHNGPIPSGHHVHHLDGNTGNNDISNLECISQAEHAAKHKDDCRNDPERLRKARELMKRIRPLANKWHQTKDGKALHKRLGALTQSMRKVTTIVCAVCSIPFRVKTVAPNQCKFCSNNCKSAFRRKSGVDNEVRRCQTCNKEFTCNKYSRQKMCGRYCGAAVAVKTRESRKNKKLGG